MRLTRWMDTLAEYNFDIEYLKGESNVVADALSRTIPESCGSATARSANQRGC